MTITRDTIIDLLPLYAAGEASADSRAAVEQHLAQDASLVALLHALQAPSGTSDSGDVPDSLEKEVVRRTRRAVNQRGWTVGLALLFTLLPLTFAFSGRELTFFMLRDEPQSVWFWASAAFLWVRYVRLTQRLKTAGL